jgi:hypothetical protein
MARRSTRRWLRTSVPRRSTRAPSSAATLAWRAPTEKLAADYGAAGAEYDVLAKLHDAEAGTH